MPTPRLRLLATAALALAAPALVAGCSSTPTSGAEPSATASSQALFSEQCQGTVIPSLPDLPPVSEGSGTKNVSTQFGDVELPVAPQDALGMYTTDVDILVWLRYPLADSQPIRGDSGYTTFPCFFPYQALAGLKTFANYPDFNYEAILAAKPDFILNGLGYGHRPDVYLQRLRRGRLARLSIEGRGGPWARGPVAGMGRGVPGTCR